MKLYNININSNNQNTAKRHNIADKFVYNTLSAETVLEYMNLQGLYNVSFKGSNSALQTPIYSVDENGVYKKYPGVRMAAKELSLESANISRCLNGNQKRVGDYTFVRAKDVETLDERNNVVIDVNKLRKINQESMIHNRAVPIYTIDTDGVCTRYRNKKSAAKALGVDISYVTHCLKGQHFAIKGCALVYADEIEKKDENGETVIDYDVLRQKYEDANRTSVYAIYKDGSYKKYPTQAEAAKELGIGANKISQCINGGSNKVSGRVFVKASDVESFEKGKVKINTGLLRKFALELASSGVKAVYSFDKEGNYTRYDSVKSIVESLNIPKSGIKNCLSGQYSASHGYRFIYAENFETMGEDGNIAVDYDKLDEISEQINPALRKRMKKYGKIYAINDVNMKEFDNVRKAARELGIDENAIVYFLKHGRNPENGKTSINGIVFTSEKDE